MAGTVESEECARRIRRRMGERIRHLRIKRGMDQSELAMRAGYKTASAITQIEQGEMNTTIDRLCAIACALEVSLGVLCAEEGTPLVTSEQSHRVALVMEAVEALPDGAIDGLIALLAHLRVGSHGSST
jgi:transcriptional regulator with XRE-family HTH domain